MSQQPASSLPADVLDALQRGDKIAAIALLRAASGLGLKEAKDAVEIQARGRGQTVSASDAPFPPTVIAALHHGRRIEAIRLLRAHAGIGLKDAKDVIDAYRREHHPEQVAAERAATARRLRWLVAWVVAALVVSYLGTAGFSG